jgi:methyl-accepting chemotaxis protein
MPSCLRTVAFRRIHYLINKRFQFRILGSLLAIVYISTFISIYATQYFLLSSIVGFMERESRAPRGDELIGVPLSTLMVVAPIIFVVVTIPIVFISHRIAGPLHRLKQHMRRVADGDFSMKLKFRKSDEIHDVADSFNDMVIGLRKIYENQEKIISHK